MKTSIAIPPLKNIRAIRENLPRFWKNVGDFPKNVGVFSAYVARFFQPLLDDAMRSLTKLVLFIKQTASSHNNSNAKITRKRSRKPRRKKDGVLRTSCNLKRAPSRARMRAPTAILHFLLSQPSQNSL